MKTISIKDIEGIRIGNAQNFTGGTGCTVILSETGMCAGLDVRGGGPASRESELLKPLAAAQSIHAVLLGGGSAFGLDAAGGVMQFLEEKGIGFDVGVTKVPLVCQSDIFDLTVADAHTRPDKAMGYEACKGAYKNNYQDGNFGVGTGATVGKFRGMDYCMKSGIGSYAVQIGELKVGAIVAVNALGDIYDHHSGRIVAGMLNEERSAFADTAKLLYSSYWMILVLSRRYSILPALISLIAFVTSIVTVPAFGFGIRPFGPSTRPRRPTTPIMSGVATTTSKSSHPSF